MQGQAGARPPRHAQEHEQPGLGLPGRRPSSTDAQAQRGDAGAPKAKLGPDHPDTLTSMNNLAANYSRLKRLDKSIPLYEETLKRSEKRLGGSTPTRS